MTQLLPECTNNPQHMEANDYWLVKFPLGINKVSSIYLFIYS